MDQVPKVLRPLVQEWTPEGYIVSFKVSLGAGWRGDSGADWDRKGERRHSG